LSARRTFLRLVSTLTAVTVLAVGAIACGDDDDDSASDSSAATEETSSSEDAASAEEVTVTADEYSFDLSATPTADTKSVTFDNQGKEFHVLIFARINEGFTVDEAIKLEGQKGSAEIVAEAEGPPGESTTIDIKKPIEAGEYAMLCPVGGPEGPHYKLGQLEEFEIQ
jgi:hypothetical protein